MKWERTGLIVEVLQNDQYKVRVDGTGRVTLRNRKNLRIIGFKEPASPFPTTIVVPARREEREKGGSRLQEPQQSYAAPPVTPVRPSTPPRQSQATVPPTPTHTSLSPAIRPTSELGNPQVPQPATPVLRRSDRAGRGQTSRYDDFVQGFHAEFRGTKSRSKQVGLGGTQRVG